MTRRSIDIEYLRQRLNEESLKVRTGVRAGDIGPPGPIVCYGVEPIPLGEPSGPDYPPEI
jgi:hypothetical protein